MRRDRDFAGSRELGINSMFDGRPVIAVGRARGSYHFRTKGTGGRLDRGERDRREGLRTNAIYHEREIDLGETEIDHILLSEGREEDGLEHLCVKGSDTECDSRAHVAEDGRAYLLLHLLDVLDRLGYQGYVGLEYKPRTTTGAGLGWAAKYGIKA